MVVKQPASLNDTDLVPGHRAEHPGHYRRREHGPYVEPAFSCQRARSDQRRITQARYAETHNRDAREQDDVLGEIHGCALWPAEIRWAADGRRMPRRTPGSRSARAPTAASL